MANMHTRKKGTRLHTFCLLICASLTISAAAAQSKRAASDSSLRVTVHDPAGAVITAAHVLIKQSGVSQKAAETNGQGEANFRSLPPGTYKVRVEAKGFESKEVADVQVSLGINSLHVSLDVANVRDEVQVTEDPRDRKLDRNS